VIHARSVAAKSAGDEFSNDVDRDRRQIDFGRVPPPGLGAATGGDLQPEHLLDS
jgi:hypothetical protein